MARRDETRLMARVARMYHEGNLKQPEIAARLHISQAKVSRLLKQAIDEELVRITVHIPTGLHVELEEALESRYGLEEVVVVDASALDEESLMRDVGAAAAHLLEVTVRPGDVIGLSSWSGSLLAMVNAVHPVAIAADVQVVQMLGGVGNPAAEVHATELTRRLARLLSGRPVLLPVPGVVGSVEARRVLERDPHVHATLEWFSKITVAFVGVGALVPSPLLQHSGNVFSEAELADIATAGGVGDICLHYFDSDGRPTPTSHDDRVIGISLEQLRRIPRRVAVAGGTRKTEAIRGALRSGCVTHLVTDATTAERLISQEKGIDV